MSGPTWCPRFRAFVAALAGILALIGAALADTNVTPLVTPDWLETNLGRDDMLIIDIRGNSAEDEFFDAHVPGSVWSKYPGGWRGEGGVPGAVPAIGDLEAHLSALGVSAEKTVVIVPAGAGSTEFGGAARVYWSFKYVGHDAVAILDGGWRAWSADPSKPTESGVASSSMATFVARPRQQILATTAKVGARLGTDTILVDSRAPDQYLGESKSAAAKRAGHISGAINLDNATFYDAAVDRIRSRTELEELMPAILGDKSSDIIAYCNAGHWSATNWFVLHELLGYENVELYVDSMIGWTQDPERPVEK